MPKCLLADCSSLNYADVVCLPVVAEIKDLKENAGMLASGLLTEVDYNIIDPDRNASGLLAEIFPSFNYADIACLPVTAEILVLKSLTF